MSSKLTSHGIIFIIVWGTKLHKKYEIWALSTHILNIETSFFKEILVHDNIENKQNI